MHKFLLIALVLTSSLMLCHAQSTTDLVSRQVRYTDNGHWFGFKGGIIDSREDFNDRWIASLMYDYRFDKNWSGSFEATYFRRVRYIVNAPYTDKNISNILALSAALKLRVSFWRPNTNVYVQGGIGAGSIYPVLHYAIGAEYGLSRMFSLYIQARQHTANLDIDEKFYSVGLNINVTPSSEREKYMLEE